MFYPIPQNKDRAPGSEREVWSILRQGYETGLKNHLNSDQIPEDLSYLNNADVIEESISKRKLTAAGLIWSIGDIEYLGEIIGYNFAEAYDIYGIPVSSIQLEGRAEDAYNRVSCNLTFVPNPGADPSIGRLREEPQMLAQLTIQVFGKISHV